MWLVVVFVYSFSQNDQSPPFNPLPLMLSTSTESIGSIHMGASYVVYIILGAWAYVHFETMNGALNQWLGLDFFMGELLQANRKALVSPKKSLVFSHGFHQIPSRDWVSHEFPEALVVNNKISNVSPPDADGGIMASQRICDELAKNLQHPGSELWMVGKSCTSWEILLGTN